MSIDRENEATGEVTIAYERGDEEAAARVQHLITRNATQTSCW